MGRPALEALGLQQRVRLLRRDAPAPCLICAPGAPSSCAVVDRIRREREARQCLTAIGAGRSLDKRRRLALLSPASSSRPGRSGRPRVCAARWLFRAACGSPPPHRSQTNGQRLTRGGVVHQRSRQDQTSVVTPGRVQRDPSVPRARRARFRRSRAARSPGRGPVGYRPAC